MDKVTIECVWYKSKRDFNRFVRSIEDPNLAIIDYLNIKSKLIKADPYKEEPHDSIVALHIINLIKSAFETEKKPVPTTIIYSFKNLNIDTVANFKELVDSQYDEDYTFALNVLRMEKTPSRAILNKFDCVKFVDND